MNYYARHFLGKFCNKDKMTLTNLGRLEKKFGELPGLGCFCRFRFFCLFAFHFEVLLLFPQPAQDLGVALISPLIPGPQQLLDLQEDLKCLKDLFPYFPF